MSTETATPKKSILTAAMENVRNLTNSGDDETNVDPIAKKASVKNALKRGAIFIAVATAVTVVCVKYIHTPVEDETSEETVTED